MILRLATPANSGMSRSGSFRAMVKFACCAANLFLQNKLGGNLRWWWSSGIMAFPADSVAWYGTSNGFTVFSMGLLHHDFSMQPALLAACGREKIDAKGRFPQWDTAQPETDIQDMPIGSNWSTASSLTISSSSHRFCFVWCGLVRVCLCRHLSCCFLFSLLWIGLIWFLCFGWFGFGVGRPSTKIALF